jgi:hypothetical protein
MLSPSRSLSAWVVEEVVELRGLLERQVDGHLPAQPRTPCRQQVGVPAAAGTSQRHRSPRQERRCAPRRGPGVSVAHELWCKARASRPAPLRATGPSPRTQTVMQRPGRALLLSPVEADVAALRRRTPAADEERASRRPCRPCPLRTRKEEPSGSGCECCFARVAQPARALPAPRSESDLNSAAAATALAAFRYAG